MLFTVYFQIYSDGKLSDPLIGRPAVIARDERAMLDWMRGNLPRERVVLAPAEMAPWVATIPMIAIYVVFHRRIAQGLTEGSLK